MKGTRKKACERERQTKMNTGRSGIKALERERDKGKWKQVCGRVRGKEGKSTIQLMIQKSVSATGIGRRIKVV